MELDERPVDNHQRIYTIQECGKLCVDELKRNSLERCAHLYTDSQVEFGSITDDIKKQVTSGDSQSVTECEQEQDWTYSMRREMQEIIPGVFLGPYSAATKAKLDNLLKTGITHIVCVRQEVESHFIRPNFPDKFKYLVFDIADSVTMNIIKFLPQVKIFIDDCLDQGGKALIHGNLGVSRSAALVIGYIMETRGLPYAEAYYLVQARRFCVNPNDGFADQLKEYEPIYKANKTLQNGQTSQETGRLKRRYDEVDESEGGSSTSMDCAT